MADRGSGGVVDFTPSYLAGGNLASGQTSAMIGTGALSKLYVVTRPTSGQLWPRK